MNFACNKTIVVLVTALSLIYLLQCAHPDSVEQLEASIRERLSQEDGVFAVAFKNMGGEATILINADTVFHAASTMKTPVMIEVFKQVAKGKFSLTDSILVKNTFASIVDGSPYNMSVDEDSEGELYRLIGQKTTLYRLVFDMITASSNLATNIIIELVDAKKVTESMRELGAANIDVLRGVEDIKAYEQGLSNSTTARDLMIIFEHLALGLAVSPEACRKMIDILKDQVWRDVIPARLPEGAIVANKTGNITGVHHDSGIVYLPDGRSYVLVLLSKNMTDFDSGTQALAEVSRMIYDHMVDAGFGD